MMSDPHNLQRFIDAQANSYQQALQELECGRKSSHWMWYIFPQIEGLGHSPTAQLYAIKSIDEARAFWHHPVLGERLRQCLTLTKQIIGDDAEAVFGYPDHMKFRSCLTLFDEAIDNNTLCSEVLDKFFDWFPCQLTLDILKTHSWSRLSMVAEYLI